MTPSEIELQEGIHWKYVDSTEDYLWVVFSHARQLPGRFNMTRRLGNVPGKKVFFADLTNGWYQKTMPQILRQIDLICREKNIKRCIFWGASMGAYASVLAACSCSYDCDAYAFAPQFFLSHRCSPAFAYLGKAVDSAYMPDIRELVQNERRGNLHCLIPCYDYQDGCQVEDALRFIPSNNQFSFTRTGHEIVIDMMAARGERVISDLIEAALHRAPIPVLKEFLANEKERRLAVLSHKRMLFVDGHLPEAPEEEPDDDDVNAAFWFSVKTRFLAAKGRLKDAIDAGFRCLELDPENDVHACILANACSGSNLPYANAIAEGLYRKVVRKSPQNEKAQLLLRWHLERIGAKEEFMTMSP